MACFAWDDAPRPPDIEQDAAGFGRGWQQAAAAVLDLRRASAHCDGLDPASLALLRLRSTQPCTPQAHLQAHAGIQVILGKTRAWNAAGGLRERLGPQLGGRSVPAARHSRQPLVHTCASRPKTHSCSVSGRAALAVGVADTAAVRRAPCQLLAPHPAPLPNTCLRPRARYGGAALPGSPPACGGAP